MRSKQRGCGAMPLFERGHPSRVAVSLFSAATSRRPRGGRPSWSCPAASCSFRIQLVFRQSRPIRFAAQNESGPAPDVRRQAHANSRPMTSTRSRTRDISPSSCRSNGRRSSPAFPLLALLLSRRSSSAVDSPNLAAQRKRMNLVLGAEPAPDASRRLAGHHAVHASLRAAFAALLAARDGHVVGALARLREEKRIGALERARVRPMAASVTM